MFNRPNWDQKSRLCGIRTEPLISCVKTLKNKKLSIWSYCFIGGCKIKRIIINYLNIIKNTNKLFERQKENNYTNVHV